MKYAHVYVLLLLFVFFTSCGEQNKKVLPKENIKTETKDTVSSSWHRNDTVIQIRKGSNGTILIASLGGVFRYDGKSFTNLTSSLGSHGFMDALEDRKGNLWFATYDSTGVYHNDGKSFQHFTTREGLASNRVICIYEDKAGNIWFGTAVGISRYDGKSFQKFTMKGEKWWDTFITTFMEDKTGKLWIATRGDVSIYDARLPARAGSDGNDEVGQGKTFTTLPYKNDRAYDVYSIMEDRNGNIWLGGWDGLRRYDGKTFTKFAHNKGYNFIIEDKEGNIWTSGSIGNSTWALSRYDQKSLNDKEPTVTKIISWRPGTSSGILEAEDGSIWFGYNGGLYRFDGKTVHTL